MNRSLIKIWLFVLFFFPLTLKLGFWQLDRSAEKAQLLAKMEHRFSQKVEKFDANKKMKTFKPYLLWGHFSDNYYLLDNRIRQGKVGYEVLSPFFIHQDKSDTLIKHDDRNDSLVLVNRGWVQASKYRSQLPQVTTSRELVPIRGYFYESAGKVPVLKEVEHTQHWPLRIQQTDWLKIQQQLDHKLLFENEFRLLDVEQGNVQSKHYGVPQEGEQTQSEIRDQKNIKYKLGWPRTTMLPSRHTAYAYQWFGLALALLVLALNATFKIRRENREHE